MKERRPDEDKSSALLKDIRRVFLRGLAIVIPAFITIWIIQFLFSFIDGIASPFYRYIGLNIPALGFITAIILIFLVGYYSRNLAVKFTIRVMERVFMNIPLAKSIYAGARELINAFSPEHEGRTFKEVCMIEYPRKGVYSIGFVTNEMSFRESESQSRSLTNVYIPLPPNPTTGMLALVPSEDVIPLNVTVEQGMKLILSAGIVSPEDFAVRDVSNE